MVTSTYKPDMHEEDATFGFVNWIHQKSRFLAIVIALIQIIYGAVMNVLVLQAILTIMNLPVRSGLKTMSGLDVEMFLTLAAGSLFWTLFIFFAATLYIGVKHVDTDLMQFWITFNGVVMIGNLIHVILFHEGLEIFARWNYSLLVDGVCIYVVFLHMMTVKSSEVVDNKNKGESLTKIISEN